MTDWNCCKLKDSPLELIDGDRGQNYPPQNEFSSDGYCLFLSTKNVRKSGFDFAEKQFISKERDSILRKGKLKKNDIILTTRGTVGNLAFYNERIPFENIRINSSMLIVRPNEEKLDPKFCFYFLRTLISNFEIYSSGSAQPQLPIKDLKEIEIYFPQISEQKKIASILSSLDDKIDLLHRQNRTLEEMAETFFRQWFIEEINENWEEKGLLDIIQIVGGGTPKTSVSEFWGEEIHWLTGGDITSNHKTFALSSEKFLTEKGLKNSSAKLLPSYSTVISARGTVGKYCILGEPMAFSQSNYGVLPRIRNCYFFTYLVVNHIVNELISAAYGSVFDTITTSTFKDMVMSLPIEDEITKFEQIVSPLFNKMLVNQKQIHTLEKLRDTLLPKLISGEVKIQDEQKSKKQ